MGATDHDVIVTLLLAMLCFVLIMGVLAVCLVRRWKGHARELTDIQPILQISIQTVNPLPDFHYVAVKRPHCWLAIKNKNPFAIQSALALHNPQPCSWVEGLSDESEQKLFVSPLVSGWVLVLGSALPDPIEDVDVCFRFLLDLSRKVGHVQFFLTNPVVNHHAWVQAEAGRIRRGYAWGGKTLWSQGAMTPAEHDLAMRCYEYADPADVLQYGSVDSNGNNAEKVHLLAARWSIDPEEIDERFIEQQWGIVGEPSRLF